MNGKLPTLDSNPLNGPSEASGEPGFIEFDEKLIKKNRESVESPPKGRENPERPSQNGHENETTTDLEGSHNQYH